MYYARVLWLLMGIRTQWGAAVARALQDFMKDHGVTQQQVADLLDQSQSYVSHRTNGRHALTVDIIGAVAELAHLTPDGLVFELSQRASRAMAAETAQGPAPDSSTAEHPSRAAN